MRTRIDDCRRITQLSHDLHLNEPSGLSIDRSSRLLFLLSLGLRHLRRPPTHSRKPWQCSPPPCPHQAYQQRQSAPPRLTTGSIIPWRRPGTSPQPQHAVTSGLSTPASTTDPLFLPSSEFALPESSDLRTILIKPAIGDTFSAQLSFTPPPSLQPLRFLLPEPSRSLRLQISSPLSSNQRKEPQSPLRLQRPQPSAPLAPAPPPDASVGLSAP